MFAVNFQDNDHIYIWLFLDSLMELVGRCVHIMERETMLCQPRNCVAPVTHRQYLAFMYVLTVMCLQQNPVHLKQSFFKLEI